MASSPRLLLALLPGALSSYCSSLTSCSSCIDAWGATGSSCSWCSKDSKCHALGSLESACTFNNDCVSLSHLSMCHGSSVEACPAAELVPEQVHLAYAGADVDGWPSGMAVSWFTARMPSNASVAYGTATGSLSSSVAASTSTYLKEYGHHHTAQLLGLTPGMRYYYQPLPGGAVRSFVTAAAAPTPVALQIFGDLGYENSTVRPMQISGHDLVKNWSASFTRATMGRLAARGAIDAVWHLGDIGYIDDSCWHEMGRVTYEETYNRFMQQISRWMQPVAAAVPYMVSVGNHESECHSPICIVNLKSLGLPLSNFSAYNARWKMPSASSGGALNMWYSWNMGPLHLVSANSETDWAGAGEETTGDSGDKRMPAGGFAAEGAYLKWLEADLARAHAERATRPWLVVGSHRPFSELNASHGELFRRYKVDLYVSGHEHSYARETIAFADGHRMLSIVVGGAGSDEQAPPHLETAVFAQAPKSAARGAGDATFATGRYASGVLNASVTRLHWQLLDSEDGTVLDDVTIAAPARRAAAPVELEAAPAI